MDRNNHFFSKSRKRFELGGSKMKKRITASFMAFALMTMLILPISAAPISHDVNLTLEVKSDYTLTIPMSTDISLDAIDTNIGRIEAKGTICADEQIVITVAKQAFVSEKDPTDTITYSLKEGKDNFDGIKWDETSLNAGTAKTGELTINIPKEEWAGAQAGNYKGFMTFSANIEKIVP